MRYSSFEVEVETSTLRDPILDGQYLEIGDFESPHPDNETIWVRLAKKILFSHWFPIFLIVLAVLSTIFFIVGLSKKMPLWLDMTDIVITFFYSLEIGARLLVFDDFWVDMWNVMDVFLLGLCVVEVIITSVLNPSQEITMGLLAFRFFVRIGRTIQVLRHQRQYRRLQQEANDIDFARIRKRSWDKEEGNYVSPSVSDKYDSSVEQIIQKPKSSNVSI